MSLTRPDRRSGTNRRIRHEARKEVDRLKYEISINTCDSAIRESKIQELREFMALISETPIS